jgi:hypothetical protein
MVRHLHLLEDIDINDVEACPSIDKSTIDGDVVNCWRAHDGSRAHHLVGDRMIFLVKAELVGRPLQPGAVGAWLCCCDLTRQLLDVAIREWSLSSPKEAGRKAPWLLVAPLVFFAVIVAWWGQR